MQRVEMRFRQIHLDFHLSEAIPDIGGQFAAAARLREQAFAAAPATCGRVDGQSFQWIADADSRLGPMLEVIIADRYFWVPFCRIRRIALEKPTDLRDLVWLPAQFAGVLAPIQT